jgi:CRP-like cAMP-binding protein
MISTSWLKKSELFEVLEEHQLNALISHAKIESLPEGKTIFHEGEEATHLYVLIEGAVDLSVATQEQIGFMSSKIQKEGETFGIPSLLEPFRYNVTAKCLFPSKLLIIRSDYLREKMEEDPRMGLLIMRKLASIYFHRLNDLRKGVISFFKGVPPKKQ